MTSPAEQRLTEQEYLALERAAPVRSEFYAGRMFAMAGGNRSHNLIVGNVITALNGQLADRPCQVYPSDMRVKIAATGLYTYPDVIVVCGDEEFEDRREDTLLNPTLVVEVLSNSTAAYDRGEKASQYRQLASLREYILIAQDDAWVERQVRQSEGGVWLLDETRGLDRRVSLAAIDCELALAAVYRKVRLPGPGRGVARRGRGGRA